MKATKRHPPRPMTADEESALQLSTEMALTIALDVLEDEKREFEEALRAACLEKRPDLKDRADECSVLELVRESLGLS